MYHTWYSNHLFLPPLASTSTNHTNTGMSQNLGSNIPIFRRSTSIFPNYFGLPISLWNIKGWSWMVFMLSPLHPATSSTGAAIPMISSLRHGFFRSQHGLAAPQQPLAAGCWVVTLHAHPIGPLRPEYPGEGRAASERSLSKLLVRNWVYKFMLNVHVYIYIYILQHFSCWTDIHTISNYDRNDRMIPDFHHFLFLVLGC